MTLDAERARAAVEEQIAGPLGLGVEQAAAGVIELFDETLPTRPSPRCWARATRRSTTRCSATAAAGRCTWPATARACPTATCSCRRGRPGSPPSAARAATTPTATTCTIDMPIAPDADDDEKPGIGMLVDGGWQMLRERVVEEFAKSGVDPDAVEYRHYVRMQYFGQLNDLEVYAPHQSIERARARRGPDRRLRGRLRQALRAQRQLARARLPGHRRDRDRLGAGGEAGAAGRASRRHARPEADPPGVVARRLHRHARSTSRTTSAPASPWPARRSSSRRPTPSRSRPGAAPGSIANRVFHLGGS